MNILTHSLMASRLKEELEGKFEFSLAHKEFVWGSIKPDIVKSPISHIKDGKINLFYNKLNNILKLNSEQERGYFSKELGEIFHFICDYFCYAHNNERLIDNTWDHVKYEYSLHLLAKKLKYKAFRINYNHYDSLSLREIIEYRHILFLKANPSLKNDLITAFQVCLIIGNKIINEHQAMNNKIERQVV